MNNKHPLVDSHVGSTFFVGNICIVVSHRGNEMGTDYLLARCLEGKNTIM
jgi:hypothetical protein